ncbi:hypothetical protein Tco_0561606 [Tanacetum coccineum]
MASDSYACWMKWWLSSDPMARGSVYDFGYVLRVECQARAVLFFPSPRFFPLGFSWEGFLRRQSQMMSYYPSMQFWVGCGDSCSLKWFLPIGVIVSVVAEISTSSLDLRHGLSSLPSPPNQSIAGSEHRGRPYVQVCIVVATKDFSRLLIRHQTRAAKFLHQ